MIFQYWHSPRLPDFRPVIRKLRGLPTSPFIVSMLGDQFMNGYLGRPNVPASSLWAAEYSVLVMLTPKGTMADHTLRFMRAPILLSPNAACQVRFGSASKRRQGRSPEFDVIFINSRNSGRNSLRPNTRLGRQREALVTALEKRFGNRFAVFGNGWDRHPSSHGPTPFDDQAYTARQARVVVGDIPFSNARYDTSNRPFIKMTSAVLFVDAFVDDVESLLRPGQHWLLSEQRKLLRTIERVSEMDEGQRNAIGVEAARYVALRHTQAHRVATLVENVRRLRESRSTGRRLNPSTPFFLDTVNLARELPLTVRNWPSAGVSTGGGREAPQ